MAKKPQPLEWLEEPYDDWQNDHELRTPSSSTRKRKKIVEFVGWGSRQLIRFLKSLGRDTKLPISQLDLAAIVNDYVDRVLLPQQESAADYTQAPAKKTRSKKKKRVESDQKLRDLFGRKSFNRTMIYKLLERHLAEANQEVDSDDSLYFVACENGDELDGGEDEANGEIKRHRKNAASSSPQSLFAAVIPQNLKLVYLRRSLVREILKQENDGAELESKIVGSFVRMKTDRNDCLHKHSHHLLQVTGLRVDSASEDENSKILLRASGVIKDIPVGTLSDEDFTEEECDELRQKIKDGELKKLTVEALQQKTNILHKDLMTLWLPRELAILQNQIDRANEKGWRREMSEYLERQELLESKEEQSRLLSEIPKVIAEEIEPKVAKPSILEELEETKDSQSETIFKTEDPVSDHTDDDFELTWAYMSAESEQDEPVQEGAKETKNPAKERLEMIETKEVIEIEDDIPERVEMSETKEVIEVENDSPQRVTEQKTTDVSDSECSANEGGSNTPERVTEQNLTEVPDAEPAVYSSTEEMWHYLDPLGEIQGPYSLALLKSWSRSGYFTPDFRIWRTGQSPNEAVCLEELLTRNLPNGSARAKA